MYSVTTAFLHDGIVREQRLHLIEQSAVDDRLMLARIALVMMGDFYPG